MKRWIGLILAVAIGLVPADAPAPCVRVHYRLLAFSSDGESVLIEQRRSGPEGGGSFAYLLFGVSSPGRRFLFSSNFSPGDGSTPQTVKRAAFEQTRRELAEALKKHKLGVDLASTGEVTIRRSAPKGIVLQPVKGELAGGGLRVGLKAKALTLSDRNGSQSLKLWAPIESLRGLSATLAAGGKLLVLVRDLGRCSTSLAVLGASSGKARDLKPIEGR